MSTMVECPDCGAESPTGRRECPECGAGLPVDQEQLERMRRRHSTPMSGRSAVSRRSRDPGDDASGGCAGC